MSKDAIKTAALGLDPAEREALAEELLLSIGDTEREAIDAAWLTEAKRRDDAYVSGESCGKPVEEIIERLRRRSGQ